MKTRFPLFLLLVSLVLFSCRSENATEKKEKLKDQISAKDSVLPANKVSISEKQFEAVGIELGQIQKKPLPSLVNANGFIVLPPQKEANVSTLIGGMVKSINVIPGNFVKKGQTLAFLASTDYIQMQEDYEKAKSNLTFLDKEYVRQMEMLSANGTSEKMVQQALNNYNVTKATVQSLQKKLELLGNPIQNLNKGNMEETVSIVAPISGYVQKVNINVGEFADPGLLMFNIVNASQLFIDLQVYEEDVDKIKEGQEVLLSLPNGNKPIGKATIYAIDKTLDSATKSITVHAKVLKNSNGALVPGDYVNAFIKAGNEMVNAVPDEAIYKDGETENVFVLSEVKNEGDNKEYVFASKEVKTGISNAGFTQVTFMENIPPDTKIATKGSYYIISEKNKGEGGDAD